MPRSFALSWRDLTPGSWRLGEGKISDQRGLSWAARKLSEAALAGLTLFPTRGSSLMQPMLLGWNVIPVIKRSKPVEITRHPCKKRETKPLWESSDAKISLVAIVREIKQPQAPSRTDSGTKGKAVGSGWNGSWDSLWMMKNPEQANQSTPFHVCFPLALGKSGLNN